MKGLLLLAPAFEFLQNWLPRFSGTHTLVRPLPTRIVHGGQDNVIDVAASRRFAASRPWVRLLEVDADHRLAGVSGVIWRQLEALLADMATGENTAPEKVTPCPC